MMAGSHVVVGAAAWAVVATLGHHPPADPAALAAAAAGALLPDIDHPKSWMGRKLWPVSVPLAALIGHRGLTHSLVAVAATLFLAATFGMGWMALPAAVGYLSHLAADALTPSGVPLLWPVRWRFALPLCRTGGVLEILVVVALALAAGWATGIDFAHLPRPHMASWPG